MCMPTPDLQLPPLIQPDQTSWHLAGTERVGAYRDDNGLWDVLHIGFGKNLKLATYRSETFAVVHAFTVYLQLTGQLITTAQVQSLIAYAQPERVAA